MTFQEVLDNFEILQVSVRKHFTRCLCYLLSNVGSVLIVAMRYLLRYKVRALKKYHISK